MSARSSSLNAGEKLSIGTAMYSRCRAPGELVGHVAGDQRRGAQRHGQRPAHLLGRVAGHQAQDLVGFGPLLVGEVGPVDVAAEPVRDHGALLRLGALQQEANVAIGEGGAGGGHGADEAPSQGVEWIRFVPIRLARRKLNAWLEPPLPAGALPRLPARPTCSCRSLRLFRNQSTTSPAASLAGRVVHGSPCPQPQPSPPSEAHPSPNSRWPRRPRCCPRRSGCLRSCCRSTSGRARSRPTRPGCRPASPSSRSTGAPSISRSSTCAGPSMPGRHPRGGPADACALRPALVGGRLTDGRVRRPRRGGARDAAAAVGRARRCSAFSSPRPRCPR